MMHRAFLAAASLAALAAPAIAEVNASLGVSQTQSEYTSGEDYDETSITAEGFWGFAPNWGVRAEVSNTEYDFTNNDLDLTHYVVHGLYRAEGWSAGAFLGAGELWDNDVNFFGAEGMLHVEDWTLAFTGTLAEPDWSGDPRYTQVQADARYYITDNFALGGGFAAVGYDSDDFSANWHNYGVGAEYRFDAFPLALSAQFRRTTWGDESSIEGVTLGARFDFGSATMRERDSNGALFNSVSDLVYDIIAWD